MKNSTGQHVFIHYMHWHSPIASQRKFRTNKAGKDMNASQRNCSHRPNTLFSFFENESFDESNATDVARRQTTDNTMRQF